VSNQFPTEDYAYLAVELPNVICEMFQPYIKLNQKINDLDIMVTGKRKPFLNSKADTDRILKYEKAFEKLKKKFESNKTRDQIASSGAATD
jgi:hypothetical protein